MNLSLPSIFGCRYTHPIQEIFRTEKYFLFSRIFTLSISWFGDLYLKKVSFLAVVKTLDNSQNNGSYWKNQDQKFLTRLFVSDLRQQGSGSATLQSVGRGCKRQSISLQDGFALQERNYQTVEKWDVQFGRADGTRYDISLLLLRNQYKHIKKSETDLNTKVLFTSCPCILRFRPFNAILSGLGISKCVCTCVTYIPRKMFVSEMKPLSWVHLQRGLSFLDYFFIFLFFRLKTKYFCLTKYKSWIARDPAPICDPAK